MFSKEESLANPSQKRIDFLSACLASVWRRLFAASDDRKSTVRNYLIKYLTPSPTMDSKSMEDSFGSTEKDSSWATKKAAGHPTASRSAKGSTACKSAKGQQRLPRQHQRHEVHREQGVKRSNSMSKGYIRDTCGKFRSKLEAGLHRGPKNGPPTPMDVCKNNFVSAESLSLRIFTPKQSKMKFCYNFFKTRSKNNKIGRVLTAISCSTMYISDFFLGSGGIETSRPLFYKTQLSKLAYKVRNT